MVAVHREVAALALMTVVAVGTTYWVVQVDFDIDKDRRAEVGQDMAVKNEAAAVEVAWIIP